MANWHYSPQFLYLQSQVYLIFMPQVVHGGGDGQGTDVITLVLVNPEWNIGTFVIHFTTNVFNITIVVFLSFFKIWNLGTHRSQRGSYNCLHCSMKVVYYIFTSIPGVVRTHFRTNPRVQFFWENQFLSFCGAPKNFFWPQTPYLALETPFWEGGSWF